MKATTEYGSTDRESIDLEPRDERALTEYLTVLEDVGRVRGAEGLYLVVSESESEYLVDAREGRCECPDHRHRGARCKHLRRVAFATGERPVPGAVDGVDEQLGMHVDATPQVLAADGGEEIIVAGDDAEILDDNAETDERPEDCMCPSTPGAGLACWPCYQAGFEVAAADSEE